MDGGEQHIGDELERVLGTRNLYEALGLEKGKESSVEEIKKAYRKKALLYHPDKGGDAEKFKAVSVAHSILSDADKKASYDRSGDVDEVDDVDSATFEAWYDYYRSMYPPITPDMIDSFSLKYKMSEEERQDVLDAYTEHGGDMRKLMQTVMMAESDEDEARFFDIIDASIATGDVESYPKYQKYKEKVKSGKKSKKRKSQGDEGESLMDISPLPKCKGEGSSSSSSSSSQGGGGGGRGQKKKDADLEALIQAKQAQRATSGGGGGGGGGRAMSVGVTTFAHRLASLEARYSKMEPPDDFREPSDEEFAKIQARIDQSRSSSSSSSTKKGGGKRK